MKVCIVLLFVLFFKFYLFLFSHKIILNIYFILFRIADQDLQCEADTQLETTNKSQHVSTNG
jgi:hypothetical protein